MFYSQERAAQMMRMPSDEIPAPTLEYCIIDTAMFVMMFVLLPLVITQ